MNNQSDQKTPHQPVAIGGVGGSGTRVFAGALRELGYFLGEDLNGPLDNLLFTLLFKREELLDAKTQSLKPLWHIFCSGMCKRPVQLDSLLREELCRSRGNHQEIWLRKRLQILDESSVGKSPGVQPRWGWKEPNTHIFARRLLELSDDLRYIHVVRDGRDMAFSRNQNQLKLWGPGVLQRPVDPTPNESLQFWCEVHRRILQLKSEHGSRVLLVNFEQMCTRPEHVCKKIAAFCRVPVPQSLQHYLESVKTPESIGRWKMQDYRQLDMDCLEFVDVVRGFASL